MQSGWKQYTRNPCLQSVSALTLPTPSATIPAVKILDRASPVLLKQLLSLVFSAVVTLAAMPALSAVEGPALSAAEGPALGASEGTPGRAREVLVLNNTPAVSPVNSIPELPTSPAITTADIAPALSTDSILSQDDLWQRIRSGFAMSDLDSPLIARHEQWYANRPGYVARMTERSQRYLYFIVEEVEKRGMPTEIALLPMIESAFNPGAYSVSHASGIWQFIPSTGKDFGLQQNWWYDGRRDIVSATNGALDYLQKLHDMFGDWELALAAYNWGEGAVQRAQERNRKLGLAVDYASLKLPDETRNYIPKLLAVKNIISDPDKFGLTLQPVPNKPYFSAVTTGRHIDVKLAAKLAGISMDEFNALNPAHNRPVILQEDEDVLLLPVDKVNTFRANLESYSDPLVSWQAYQSKKGERLDKLAPRFGLSVAKLKSINGLPTRAKVSNGQALLVPLNGEEADEEFEAFNTHLAPNSQPPRRALTHTVRKGETLNSISRRYHVSAAKLKNWNGGIKQIKPGQRITIVQATNKPQRLAKSSNKPHRVVKASKSHVKLARSGKSRTHAASTAKSHKHLAHNTQRRLHVAYNR